MPRATSARQIEEWGSSEDSLKRDVSLTIGSVINEANGTTSFQGFTSDNKLVRITYFGDHKRETADMIKSLCKGPVLEDEYIKPLILDKVKKSSSDDNVLDQQSIIVLDVSQSKQRRTSTNAVFDQKNVSRKNLIHFLNVRIGTSCDSYTESRYRIIFDKDSVVYKGRLPVPKLAELEAKVEGNLTEFKDLKLNEQVTIYGIVADEPQVERQKFGSYLAYRILNGRYSHVSLYFPESWKCNLKLHQQTEVAVRGVVKRRMVDKSRNFCFYISNKTDVRIMRDKSFNSRTIFQKSRPVLDRALK